ncbi:MAG: ABC transporter ATP-binding protein [Rubrivivax sp.]
MASQISQAPLRAGHNLRLSNISHRYGDSTALAAVDLDIAPGELIALLGPSGCGKTTLLRIIAGFLTPSTGSVLVDGQAIGAMPPNLRNIGIVFQNYALFPHMTVLQNVCYGPRAKRIPKQQCVDQAQEMLRLVKMELFAGRYPAELSGGQQQRVALARAFAIEPKILLLDEPFSALDKNLRLDMQIEVKELLKHYGITSIIVTHDQEEALSMADRIVVLNQGRVEQTDTPAGIYSSPASLFVNTFVGHTNLLSATVESAGADCMVKLDCGPILSVDVPGDSFDKGSKVLVSVRPENLRLAEAADATSIAARVRQNLPLGPVDVMEVQASDGTGIKLTTPHQRQSRPTAVGSPVNLVILDPQACSVFRKGTVVQH